MDLLLHSFFFVLCFPQYIEAYCKQIGLNPGFSDPPVVSTIGANKVRVSWKDVVTNRKCADSFFVEYRKSDFPESWKESKSLGADANFIDLTVLPDTEYDFEVIATEDRGNFHGIAYFRGPRFERFQFRMNNTSSDNVASENDVGTATG